MNVQSRQCGGYWRSHFQDKMTSVCFVSLKFGNWADSLTKFTVYNYTNFKFNQTYIVKGNNPDSNGFEILWPWKFITLNMSHSNYQYSMSLVSYVLFLLFNKVSVPWTTNAIILYYWWILYKFYLIYTWILYWIPSSWAKRTKRAAIRLESSPPESKQPILRSAINLFLTADLSSVLMLAYTSIGCRSEKMLYGIKII